MTFASLYQHFIKKYQINDDYVLYQLIFFLSSKVKNKIDFIKEINTEIDFDSNKLNNLLKDYYLKQKPLAHITGLTSFCGLEFIINKHVLSPRDVTENLVKLFINKYKDSKPLLIYDLCCGSGVIGITIKKYCPQHSVIAVDISKNACNNSIINAKKNNVDVSIIKSDCFKFLNKNCPPDIIISNPPYISRKFKLNKKMFKWENKKALIAKNNGLFFYQKFHDYSLKNSEIKFWFEIGFDQKNILKEMFKPLNSFYKVSFFKCDENYFSIMLLNDIINYERLTNIEHENLFK